MGTHEATLSLRTAPPVGGTGPTEAFELNVVLDQGTAIAQSMQVTQAASASAEFALQTTFFGRSLGEVPVTIPAALTGEVDPDTGAAKLVGRGQTPSVTSIGTPDLRVLVDGFSVNMTWRTAAGEPIRFEPLTRDVSGEPVSDSDGNPDTFDVYCMIDPPTQSRVLVETAPICLPVIVPPKPPTAVELGAGDIGTGRVHLRWGPPVGPEDPCAQKVQFFRIKYEDKTFTVPADQSGAEVGGLLSDHDYRFEVFAVGTFDIDSVPLVIDVRTNPVVGETYRYSTQGAAAIRTLVRGAVPVGGSMMLTSDPWIPSMLTGTTELIAERAHLVAFGFIPLDATLTFVPNGETTATFDGTQLTTRSRFRIKLSDISIFGGAIPFAPIGDCQTRRPSALNLKSVGDFTLATGGQLQGTFAIGDLTGCAGLSGLLSLLTAGNGNSMSVALAPQAPPTAG